MAEDIIEGLISDKEKFEAENVIKRHYNADNVRLLQVQVQFTLFRLTPFYLPTFIFETSYLGNPFHTFVGAAALEGPALKVSGQQYFSWERIALLSAGAGGLYAVITGLHRVFSGFSIVWLFLVLPAFIGAFGSRYFPLAYQAVLRRYQEFERSRMKAREGARGQSTWDDEKVGGYRQERAEQRRTRDREYEYQYSRAGGRTRMTGDLKDPKGYYKVLGVSPGATKEEVQSAFRGLAMKDHPDRYSDPKEKEAAKVRFQKLSEAYTVLRDGEFWLGLAWTIC